MHRTPLRRYSMKISTVLTSLSTYLTNKPHSSHRDRIPQFQSWEGQYEWQQAEVPQEILEGRAGDSILRLLISLLMFNSEYTYTWGKDDDLNMHHANIHIFFGMGDQRISWGRSFPTYLWGADFVEGHKHESLDKTAEGYVPVQPQWCHGEQ